MTLAGGAKRRFDLKWRRKERFSCKPGVGIATGLALAALGGCDMLGASPTDGGTGTTPPCTSPERLAGKVVFVRRLECPGRGAVSPDERTSALGCCRSGGRVVS